jgi:hypothetical protein
VAPIAVAMTAARAQFAAMHEVLQSRRRYALTQAHRLP